MQISQDDFQNCRSISVDTSFVQPKIRMCRDIEGKQLIHQFECQNEEKADDLFHQLMNAWDEVRLSEGELNG